MRYEKFSPAEAVEGFAWIAADSRKMTRVHSSAGNPSAAKRSRGLARRLGKLSKNAQGEARREAKQDRRWAARWNGQV